MLENVTTIDLKVCGANNETSIEIVNVLNQNSDQVNFSI